MTVKRPRVLSFDIKNTQVSMFEKLIKDKIGTYGYHITSVINGVEPSYTYTIGLYEKTGFELVFAGGIYYMRNEVEEIVNSIVDQFRVLSTSDVFTVKSYGSFRLSSVHPSWSTLMLLGVFDHYKTDAVQAFQIIPDDEHFTLEIPDMSNEWIGSSEPVWKWLAKEWDYPVPKNSTVATNMEFFFGQKITEVARWETDEWEAFVGPGPDVGEKDVRIISLGTLLGIDPSLLPIVELEVGKGIWRDPVELNWQKWN